MMCKNKGKEIVNVGRKIVAKRILIAKSERILKPAHQYNKNSSLKAYHFQKGHQIQPLPRANSVAGAILYASSDPANYIFSNWEAII